MEKKALVEEADHHHYLSDSGPFTVCYSLDLWPRDRAGVSVDLGIGRRESAGVKGYQG